MAKNPTTEPHPNAIKWTGGHLDKIDSISHGDESLGAAISTYADTMDTNRKSRHWIRSVQWIENILFTVGRHYIDDILISRLTRDSSTGNLSTAERFNLIKHVPRPTNDILGSYLEPNIALFTENRPRPRVTPKSKRAEDQDRAELSELTLDYLWEALDMPELHREIVRLMLHCGVCWMEILYDPTQPRRVPVPITEITEKSFVTGPDGKPLEIPVPREVPKIDENGRIVFSEQVEFGDVSAKVVSPFEMHLPPSHWWTDIGWVMREYYTPISNLKDDYSENKRARKLNKQNGWFLDRLEDVKAQNVRDLPLWWWERLTDLIEGPGPSIYIGTPEQWEDHTVVRIFDRKPNAKWPKGRTVIVAGDQVIYDSPKKVGARAYDPRWPDRWHPYVRFRWEPIPGSIYGRSLVSKLLPKLKRINAIDTTLIMWRRTVPIAKWIAPKGTHVIEDQWTGQPGTVLEYDPRRTAGAEPKPVYPPDYPRTALEERAMQLAEMEMIAGTEEILRGQRPAGATSASMLEVLRKQVLSSKSSIMQAWDESLQKEGSYLLQEVIKNIREDPGYAEMVKIIASERASRLTISNFSGANLSDNVLVRVDTASQASVSKEARELRAIEALQYSSALMTLPQGLRIRILEELGWDDALKPQGPDVDRAKRMLGWIRQGDYQRVIPFPEDDPYVFYETLVEEMKSDAFYNLNEEQQLMVMGLIDSYRQKIEFREIQAAKLAAVQSELVGPKGGRK